MHSTQQRLTGVVCQPLIHSWVVDFSNAASFLLQSVDVSHCWAFKMVTLLSFMLRKQLNSSVGLISRRISRPEELIMTVRLGISSNFLSFDMLCFLAKELGLGNPQTTCSIYWHEILSRPILDEAVGGKFCSL